VIEYQLKREPEADDLAALYAERLKIEVVFNE